MKTKLYAIFLLPVFLFLTALQADASQKIRLVGDLNYPPYSFMHEGEVDGIYVHIFKALLPRLEGYEVTLELKPWKRALEEARTGKAFGVFPPYYRPVERPWITQYTDPILEEQNIVVCNNEVAREKPRPLFPKDYYGLTFGKSMGFHTGSEAFLEAVRNHKIRIQEAGDTRNNLQKIVLGRVDCHINDRRAIEWYLMSTRAPGFDEDCPKLSDDPSANTPLVEMHVVQTEHGHIGFSNKVDSRDFILQFNAILAKMKESGELDAVIHDFLSTHKCEE